MVNCDNARDKLHFKTALFFSLALVVLVALVTLPQFFSGRYFGIDLDPDSNTRLQQVRDLLAGQNWYDLTLKRLGVDGGTNMHWSRLADLGPAALLWLFSLFLEQAQSETAVTIVYPLLLIMPLAFALMWTTNRIIDGKLTTQMCLAVGVVAIQLEILLVHFVPGNLDHHNLQIIALLVFLGSCCGIRDFRSGLIGALGLIGGVTVGLDGVPAIIATIAILGCLWLWNPKAETQFLSGLGAGIIGLSLVSAVIFIPRPLSLQWCDSWTVPVSAIMMGLGGFLLAASAMGERIQNRWILGAIAIVLGCALLGGLLLQFPACRQPLPLSDPLIQLYWMSLGSENASLTMLYKSNPAFLAIFAPVILALCAYVVAVQRKWLLIQNSIPLMGAFIASILLSCFYMRGMSMMSAILVPLLAGILTQIVSNSKTLVARLSAWLVFAPSASLLLVGGVLEWAAPKSEVQIETRSASQTSERNYACVVKSDLAKIRALPLGTIISPFGLTEYLLRYTNLQVAFAGYHRAYRSNLDIMRWLVDTPAHAHQAFQQHKVRYLTICPTSGQQVKMATDYPNSLIAAALGSRVPTWLKPVVQLQDGGMIYEVSAPEKK